MALKDIAELIILAKSLKNDETEDAIKEQILEANTTDSHITKVKKKSALFNQAGFPFTPTEDQIKKLHQGLSDDYDKI